MKKEVKKEVKKKGRLGGGRGCGDSRTQTEKELLSTSQAVHWSELLTRHAIYDLILPGMDCNTNLYVPDILWLKSRLSIINTINYTCTYTY